MAKIDDMSTVSSGASYGALPDNRHAALAVRAALEKLPGNEVGSVLLFLTSGYAHAPQEAIKQAVITAGTPMVSGCCAMALLSDQEWLLDVEGAVALVFPPQFALQPWSLAQQNPAPPELALTLTSPNAVSMAINSIAIPQFGALCSDEYGHGPFSLWQSGRIVEQEFWQAAIVQAPGSNATTTPPKVVFGKADGVQRLSASMQINRSDGLHLLEAGEQPAAQSLADALPDNLRGTDLHRPFNLLMGISESSDPDSLEQGHYRLLHVISVDQDTGDVQLSGSIKAGRHMFWAIRDQRHAMQAMRDELNAACKRLGQAPKFALMFPNISRGPEFYNGRDRDLEIFQELLPNCPMVGFYGHGEILPGHRRPANVHHFTTAFALFA